MSTCNCVNAYSNHECPLAPKSINSRERLPKCRGCSDTGINSSGGWCACHRISPARDKIYMLEKRICELEERLDAQTENFKIAQENFNSIDENFDLIAADIKMLNNRCSAISESNNKSMGAIGFASSSSPFGGSSQGNKNSFGGSSVRSVGSGGPGVYEHSIICAYSCHCYKCKGK